MANNSKSARSGVIPTPAPINKTFRRRRRCLVKLPYGPSSMTLVPGRRLDQTAAVVSERLGRKAKPAAIGRGGKAERVGLPPTFAGEEAPHKELTGLSFELLEPPAGDVNGRQPGAFAHRTDDHEAMAGHIGERFDRPGSR